MRARSAALLLAALAGCATPSAPAGWLPKAENLGKSHRGAWVEIEYRGEKGDRVLGGELLAVSKNDVWILVRGEIVELASEAVDGGRVHVHEPLSGAPLAAWAVLGGLSTISHGFFLVLTVPLWTLGGTASALAQQYSGSYRFRHPKEVSAFARFPQGLPPGYLQALPER